MKTTIETLLMNLRAQVIKNNFLEKINGSFCITEIVNQSGTVFQVMVKYGSQDEGGGDVKSQLYTINTTTLDMRAILTPTEAIQILRSIPQETVIDDNWEEYLYDDIILLSAVLLVAGKKTYRQVNDSFEGFYIPELISEYIRRTIIEHKKLLQSYCLYVEGDEVSDSIDLLIEISNQL